MALKMAFTDIAEAKAALSKVLELMNSSENRAKLGPLLEECKGDPAKRTTVIVPILQELFGVMLKEFNFPNGVDSEDPAEKKKKNGQGVMCAMMAFNTIVTANPDDAELKTAKELAMAALQGELPDEAAVADIVTKLRA